MKKIKILYIIHDNKKGGAAVSFLDMIRLIKDICDIEVITPHKKGFIPSALDEMGIKYHSVYYIWWEMERTLPGFIKSGYRSILPWNHIASRIIAHIAIKNKADIIHSNSSTIDVGSIAAQKAGIPHLWHLREIGQLIGLEPLDDKHGIKDALDDGYSNYIAISKYVKSSYLKYISENRIEIIYNGISEFYNYEKDFGKLKRGTQTKFLITGNYSEVKGHLIVVKAIYELNRRGIDNFKVYMAGSGDYKEIKKYISKENISKYVEFLGQVSNILEIRKNTDVEIVACRAEAFGRVTIEAMRASNPVIASNSGANIELINDNETGMLFEQDNAIDLADKMQFFIDDYERISYMGRNAYLTAKDRYTSEKNSELILKMYNSMLNKDSL